MDGRIGALAGRDRDLQLGVEVGPGQALLLDADAAVRVNWWIHSSITLPSAPVRPFQ